MIGGIERAGHELFNSEDSSLRSEAYDWPETDADISGMKPQKKEENTWKDTGIQSRNEK